MKDKFELDYTPVAAIAEGSIAQLKSPTKQVNNARELVRKM